MQTWTDDIWHLVLVELHDEARPENNLCSKDTCIDFDVDYTQVVKYISSVAHVALSCHRLRAIAQPFLYERVHLQRASRAEDLMRLLNVNSHLLSSTRHLVLGRSNVESDLHLGSNPYLASTEAKQLFTHFVGLLSLRISGLRITSDFITTCFADSDVRSLQELHVDTCSFSSLPDLQCLIEIFHDLKTLILHFSMVGPSNLDNEFCASEDVHVHAKDKTSFTPDSRFHGSHLRTLELRPMSMGDKTPLIEMLCHWLINSGRARLLHSVHFSMDEATQVAAIEDLIHHAAHTLTSLTLNCNGYFQHTTLPDLIFLTRLQRLHLKDVGFATFKAIAALLMILVGSRYQPEIMLDMNFSNAALSSTEAIPIWTAIESLANCPHFTLNISCVAYATIKSMDQCVRSRIPQTNLRGAVDIHMSIICEDSEDSDGYYGNSIFE